MKNLLLISVLILALAMPTALIAQSKADKVVGYYLTHNEKTGKEESQIKIYKTQNGKYSGEIVWMDKSYYVDGKPIRDINNPDEKLRSKELVGLQMLKGFTYDARADEWGEGHIYNPMNGKSYKSNMKLEGNQLKLRGYIGKSWMGLGKTTTWIRTESLKK